MIPPFLPKLKAAKKIKITIQKAPPKWMVLLLKYILPNKMVKIRVVKMIDDIFMFLVTFNTKRCVKQ